MARRFGAVTNVTLVVLVLTGIYNASWYLPSWGRSSTLARGKLVLVKAVLVVALVLLVYLHASHFGRKIVGLARRASSRSSRRSGGEAGSSPRRTSY